MFRNIKYAVPWVIRIHAAQNIKTDIFTAPNARNENVGGAVTLPRDVIPPADRISILVELPKSIIGRQAGLPTA